jgi:hypothetical protein
MGFEFVAIALLGILAVLGTGVFLAWMVYLLIRRLLWKTTHRILDRTVDQVVQAGERHLVSGVGTLARSVQEEMRKNDPRRQEADISRLAKARSGRITVADVMAGLDLPQDRAERTLDGLASRGVCRVTIEEEGGKAYLFEAFMARRDVACCDYCGGSFEDAETDHPCPNCGAVLTRKNILA